MIDKIQEQQKLLLIKHLERDSGETLEYTLAEFSAVSYIPIVEVYCLYMWIEGVSQSYLDKIDELKEFYK